MDYKESWQLKIWCFWTVVLKKMLEGCLDYQETQPLHPKGNQVWIHIGKTNIEPETPLLWPLDVKSWLIWKLLWFACECGSPTWTQGLRGHCHWIMTSMQAHSSCVTLSMQETGKAIFLGGRKGIHRECVFRPLFAASVLLLRRQTCRPAPRASIPESGLCVSLRILSLANIFLGQSGAAMRKKAEGVQLRSGAMMGSPGRGHLAHQMVPRQGVMDQPLAGDIPKRGAKLAGSEGGKQQWDGFSSSC